MTGIFKNEDFIQIGSVLKNSEWCYRCFSPLSPKQYRLESRSFLNRKNDMEMSRINQSKTVQVQIPTPQWIADLYQPGSSKLPRLILIKSFSRRERARKGGPYVLTRSFEGWDQRKSEKLGKLRVSPTCMLHLAPSHYGGECVCHMAPQSPHLKPARPASGGRHSQMLNGQAATKTEKRHYRLQGGKTNPCGTPKTVRSICSNKKYDNETLHPVRWKYKNPNVLGLKLRQRLSVQFWLNKYSDILKVNNIKAAEQHRALMHYA